MDKYMHILLENVEVVFHKLTLKYYYKPSLKNQCGERPNVGRGLMLLFQGALVVGASVVRWKGGKGGRVVKWQGWKRWESGEVARLEKVGEW